MNQEISSPPNRSDPENIRKMFNAIAPTYDVLNHLMSLGLDIHWRRKAIRFFQEKRNGTFLDIAAGSGDVSIDLLELHPARVVATDFAFGMLTEFERKLARRGNRGTVDMVSADALALPFPEASFDGTIVAFGMRNFADRLKSLEEMLRVLKPGGIAVILELTKPHTPIIAQIYSVYAEIILPFFGKMISRHNSAYRYLPESIAQFPAQGEFCRMMRSAGFLNPRAIPLSFGTATIFAGSKSGSSE